MTTAWNDHAGDPHIIADRVGPSTDRVPHWLVVEIQKFTNFPWWNGKAYDDYHGLSANIRMLRSEIGSSIDDLSDVIDLLREEKQFDKADRIRTIVGCMARRLPAPSEGEAHTIRAQARGWR